MASASSVGEPKTARARSSAWPSRPPTARSGVAALAERRIQKGHDQRDAQRLGQRCRQAERDQQRRRPRGLGRQAQQCGQVIERGAARALRRAGRRAVAVFHRSRPATGKAAPMRAIQWPRGLAALSAEQPRGCWAQQVVDEHSQGHERMAPRQRQQQPRHLADCAVGQRVADEPAGVGANAAPHGAGLVAVAGLQFIGHQQPRAQHARPVARHGAGRGAVADEVIGHQREAV